MSSSAMSFDMTLVTVTPTGKKVVAPISRPHWSEFDLPVSQNLVWRGGVYICVDGRKEYYFSCELPLCVNGDALSRPQATHPGRFCLFHRLRDSQS
ncbi:hypothetical protein QUA56_16450 [Microcoleus sp. N3A4]|uniref:hypothetical protein n=1 Tax=Microcoleus sp. N3A4 TaxID=3055379 RepID=UPI002FCFC3C6